LPLVAFAPDHAPDAAQEDALVDDHVRVVGWPREATVVGLAERVTVGAEVGATTVVATEAVSGRAFLAKWAPKSDPISEAATAKKVRIPFMNYREYCLLMLTY
jgi:hypothetical protein